MEDLVIDREDIGDTGESAEWCRLVDRGGLCYIKEDTYTFFFEVEIVFRTHYNREMDPTKDGLKQSVIQSIISNADVKFVWSKQ